MSIHFWASGFTVHFVFFRTNLFSLIYGMELVFVYLSRKFCLDYFQRDEEVFLVATQKKKRWILFVVLCIRQLFVPFKISIYYS